MRSIKSVNIKRVIDWTLVIFVLVLLLLPLISMNHQKEKVLKSEKRIAANFPDVFDEEGKLSKEFGDNFELWFNDNLGCRDKFANMASDIQIKVLHQSTDNQVELGRQGWLFYTPNHNIELATGQYRLTLQQLQQIAKNQQWVSDWYENKGIVYLLVLEAAKSSIYPEFIASHDCEVCETICEQVENYLKANTTVHVVNTKNALLDEKEKNSSILYYKTDTHWTDFGAYVVYQTITNELQKMNLNMKSFDVFFNEGDIIKQRDLPAIMGASDNIGEKITKYATWEKTAKTSTDKNLHEQYQVANAAEPVIIDNPSAKNGILLIYGDSQWIPERNLPQLLGESFQRVVSLYCAGDYNYHTDIDELVKPNVVIYGCGERFIDTRLVQTPNLPEN